MTRRAACAVVAFFFALASPALALKWERVSGLPANGFISGGPSPKLAMWRADGVGLLALQEPTPQQFLTTNGGRSWARISDHSIGSVYMISNTTAFATGQLASQRSAAKPDAVLKWTRAGNQWSISLVPPTGAGICVTQVEVTDGGQTVFLLGNLLFKDKQGALGLVRSDGAKLQYLWRYRAATDNWEVINAVKSTVVEARRGAWSQSMASITASSSSALWATWDGTAATGGSAAGRITFWNGTAWSNFRNSNNPGTISQLKGVSGQVFAAVRFPTIAFQPDVLQHRNGTKWVDKLTTSFPGFFTPMSAPSANFALVAEAGQNLGGKTARVWRWNGATSSFTKAWELPSSAGSIDDVVADAYSDTRAVVAAVFDMKRVVARRWFGSKWESVDTLRCASNVVCAVSSLVTLPGGSALLSLVGNGGVWRLVA